MVTVTAWRTQTDTDGHSISMARTDTNDHNVSLVRTDRHSHSVSLARTDRHRWSQCQQTDTDGHSVSLARTDRHRWSQCHLGEDRQTQTVTVSAWRGQTQMVTVSAWRGQTDTDGHSVSLARTDKHRWSQCQPGEHRQTQTGLPQYVGMMTLAVPLSLLEAIQRKAWVTASTSTVKLELETE